jgi:4'-phosphopantetheinyl transferase
VKFNVSHSGDVALIAIGYTHELGIDIERRRHISHFEQIASRYFHAHEVAAIHDAPPDSRNDTFLRLWTAKEAILKAIGIGIVHSLNVFEVPAIESFEGWVGTDRLSKLTNSSRCWLQRINPHDEYIAALAVVDERPRLVCRTFVN